MQASPKSKVQSTKFEEQTERNFNQDLTTLLSSGNIASKQWVYRQYDHMVRTNTAVLPGADAAVVRIKETRRALSMTLDGNGRYCAASPREGAKLIVAEAARNVVCTGARPIAITNCLNFASPERPEVMWSFSEIVDGMAEACRTFNTPVVSGNVSFYNETEGKGILPTPVIGMLGLVEDVRRVVTSGFKTEGDLIALLGTTNDDLATSEYAVTIGGVSTESIASSGIVPRLDLELEAAVQRACLEAAESGLLQSAHDCSDGGLAVALAESCFSTLGSHGFGATIDLQGSPGVACWLFSESPSRIVISFASQSLAEVEAIAARTGAPIKVIGRVGGTRLSISIDDEQVLDSIVSELETAWRRGLSQKLQAEAVAAGRE
jgi:phosphoribosylformylglycinamidine synthase